MLVHGRVLHRCPIGFNDSLWTTVGRSGFIIPIYDRWAIGYQPSLLIVQYSVWTIPLYDRCLIVFNDPILRSLAAHTWWSLLTIVGRSFLTTPLTRLLAECYELCLLAIVGRPFSEYIFLPSLNNHLLRTILRPLNDVVNDYFGDHWPMVDRSSFTNLLYERWAFVLNDYFHDR